MLVIWMGAVSYLVVSLLSTLAIYSACIMAKRAATYGKVELRGTGRMNWGKSLYRLPQIGVKTNLMRPHSTGVQCEA
jgi:hypothetical protein